MNQWGFPAQGFAKRFIESFSLVTPGVQRDLWQTILENYFAYFAQCKIWACMEILVLWDQCTLTLNAEVLMDLEMKDSKQSSREKGDKYTDSIS